MPEIRYPEFRDELEFTNYPFSDAANLTNDAGEFLQQDMFLDASFYVLGATSRLYLSSIDIAHESCTLTLGDAQTAEIASGEFSLLDPPDSVRFLSPHGQPAELLISTASKLGILAGWTLGKHTFRLGQTEFAASVCLPVPMSGLTGFLLASGDALTGDVWLVGEDGIILSHQEIEIPQINGTSVFHEVVRVDVIGDPLFRRRLCEVPTFFVTPKFIRRLIIRHGSRQFVAVPDVYGDIQLGVGNLLANDTILRFRAVPEGLIIEALGTPLE